MRVEPELAGRKRIQSSASEMEPERKMSRLSGIPGRSPLRPIQQSRRRSRPAPVRKGWLTEARAGPAGPRAAADRAAQPRHTSTQHGYETRAAANRRQTEKADSDIAEPPAEKPPLAEEEAEPAEDHVSPPSGRAGPAAGPVQLVSRPAVAAVIPQPSAGRPSASAEAEYIEEMVAGLLCEERSQRLEPAFLCGQLAVTAADRAVVVDWLILVQHYLRLANGTLHLSVSLLDRVLAGFSCPLDGLQLLGVACLWLAAKMEEPRLPSSHQLLRLTMDGYSLSALLDMERLVLHVTEFRLLRVHPASLVSLQLYRRRDTQGGARLADTCSYLLDVAGCRLGGVARPPSLVAAGVIRAAQLLLITETRHAAEPASHTDNFCHREEEVLAMVTLLLVELCDSQDSKLQGARKKYSSQSRYRGLALSPHLSASHAQRVLQRHLDRPPPNSPGSPELFTGPATVEAELSHEY